MKFEYKPSELTGSDRIPEVRRPADRSVIPIAKPSAGWLKMVFFGVSLTVLAGGAYWWFSLSGPQEYARPQGPTVVATAHDGCRRIGLCIGLNIVDPQAYPDYAMAELRGCCNDADRFGSMLSRLGYSVNVLKDAEATVAEVGRQFNDAAEKLSAGDIFVVLISGHGGREERSDGKMHENWALYDGFVWDERIVMTLSRFQKGVRILIINDQCHSGGLFLEKNIVSESHRRYWISNRRESDWSAEKAVKSPDFPQVIQFAGCRAEQTSMDTSTGGEWTMALMQAHAENTNLTFRSWFDSSFAKLKRGKQDPQWVEKGEVRDDFREGRALE